MNVEASRIHQKALEVNLDANTYGTFAEIGAGQEVARWFFRVGGAAGTVAKTISAYDMTVSDAIYGPAERYVTRQRLQAMFDHEYGLLLERLHARRGAQTRFFVFADTVKARGYKTTGEAHGWMGLRFQTAPLSEPSEIIIHVRLLDRENVQQQEALGIVGVNVIHGGLYRYEDPVAVIRSLREGLASERIEVDMVKFSGPAFPQVDNRLMSLELVRHGLSDAAMFTADGEVVQAAEVLYKKPILVERGRFRPITNVTLDMLECARAQFVQEPQVAGEPIVVLLEMTLNNLSETGDIENRDFLDRVDLLGTLGQTVLISQYAEFHRLATYLFRYTKKMIGLVMGVPTLRKLFEEKYYTDLEGGILESFGRMFQNNLKIYAYPTRDPVNGALITADNLVVAPNLRHLYAHLLENRHLESLRGFDPTCLPIASTEVLAKLRSGDASWEKDVPPSVAALIKQRRLFGYAG